MRETSEEGAHDSFMVSVPMVIDVVAAVKEALRDSTVRDQIRALVLEFAPAPANDVEELLDTPAAAAFMRMTPAALRMAVHRGTIPCLRVGRRLRFRRSALTRQE